ncbi:MAG: right-handed parallel beta-helix repeat-containing protein, partial [Firmicutes bacterium]|nr:right-handed parallel beta-helix repeat-containing protein [Bacillota bacterium]
GLGDTPLVTIEDSKYLTFCNMELQNVKTAIEVKNSKAIILAGLNIHDLRAIGTDQIMQEVDDDGHVISETVIPGPKAYGIKVIGDTPTATRSILIYYNTIEHINRGAGVHVEGNAEHINMFANKMMSIGGSGIEYIGATGMCQQDAYDAPRDCTIKANSIGACKAKSSGGYGILIDSARSITMSENITYRCDVGYGIMSAVPYDQSYQSDEIELKNSLTACDYKGGIVIGSSNGDKGYLNSVKIMNNTCLNTYDDDTGSDFKASNVGSLVVRKNIFCNAKASGPTMWIGEITEGQPEIIIDGNIYATPSKPGTAKFVYGGRECSGYTTYKKSSGEQTGYYTQEDYTTLCPNLLYGDYSFMNYGIQVGATVIDPKTIKDKEED